MSLYLVSVLLCYLAYADSPLLAYQLIAAALYCLYLVRSAKRSSLLLYGTVILLLYLLFGRATLLSRFHSGFEEERITYLEGVLLEDSLLTKGGSQLLRVKVQWCEEESGVGTSARGVCSALINIDEVLIASSNVALYGAFDEPTSLFIAKDFQVLELTPFGVWRRERVEGIGRRLDSLIPHEQARSLALMLLLGQSDSSAFPLKVLAQQSGLSHLLALSGMHLSIFLSISTLVCSLIFGPYWARRVGIVFPILFVLIAGPKPSLIRALTLALCSLLPFGEHGRLYSYLSALIMQLLFTPHSVTSLAFTFSWIAYTMIVIAPDLPSFPLKGGTLATLAIAPITLLLDGTWNIGGIVLTSIAGSLIHLCMIASLLVLFFGSLFVPLMIWCEFLLSDLLIWSSAEFTSFGLPGYLIALALVLTLFFALIYAKRCIHKQETYELELSLRFTECNNDPSRGGGVGDEQEVWTKLPHLSCQSNEDCRSS